MDDKHLFVIKSSNTTTNKLNKKINKNNSYINTNPITDNKNKVLSSYSLKELNNVDSKNKKGNNINSINTELDYCNSSINISTNIEEILI
jgi:hypothetical protein